MSAWDDLTQIFLYIFLSNRQTKHTHVNDYNRHLGGILCRFWSTLSTSLFNAHTRVPGGSLHLFFAKNLPFHLSHLFFIRNMKDQFIICESSSCSLFVMRCQCTQFTCVCNTHALKCKMCPFEWDTYYIDKYTLGDPLTIK